MAVKELEIILTRQLADSLSIPIFITDTDGTLLFFNEPAEKILGKKYTETGALSTEEWSSLFEPQDQNGKRIARIDLPLVKTLTYCQPAQKEFWIKNLLDERYYISVTSFPLIGRSKRFVGAMAIFWEKASP
ncbi:MAG: PAS domain-containing protein [Bacteroidota bacterium]